MKSNSSVHDKKLIRRGATFGFLAMASGVLFVLGLRSNSQGAVRRYDSLIAADQAGGDVEGALNDLRSFIYVRMNSEIGGPHGIYPPIQLSGTYDRLVTAEEARVKEANDQLYSEAQAYCETYGSRGFSGRNRLDCINAYIDENGAQVQAIDSSLYKYDFVAPRWSPDLAGFSLLFVILFGAVTLAYLLRYLHIRHLVRASN